MITNVLAIVMGVAVLAALVYLFFYVLPKAFMTTLLQDVDEKTLKEYEEKTWKMFQAAPPLGDDMMTPLLLAMLYQESLNSKDYEG